MVYSTKFKINFSLIYLYINCIIFSSTINAQCIADAGEDQAVCVDIWGEFDTTILGGIPSVINGIYLGDKLLYNSWKFTYWFFIPQRHNTC